MQHAALGCIGLWCETAIARLPVRVPAAPGQGASSLRAQVIYCRDIADFVRFAGPIGRYLALHGWPFVILDANGPIPGLVGLFRRGAMPKYFRGPQCSLLGDLAYTEYALLGV